MLAPVRLPAQRRRLSPLHVRRRGARVASRVARRALALGVVLGIVGCGGRAVEGTLPKGPPAPAAGADPSAEPRAAQPAPVAGPQAWPEPTFTLDEGLRDPRDPEEWTPLATFADRPVAIRREFSPDGQRLMRIHTVLVPEDPEALRLGEVVLHGPDWRYFESGFAARVERWHLGDLDGPVRAWWPTGHLREEGRYERGARVGLWRHWNKQKQLLEEGAYVAGQRDGLHRTWYADGQLEEEATYRLGTPDGPHRRFGRIGQPQLAETHVAGVLHGPWADHYPESGALRQFGEYDHGAKVGPWRVAREDAEGLLLEERYVAGRRNGLQRTWSAEGTLISELTYVDDAQTGPCRSWYPAGGPQSEGALEAGLRVGPWKYWSPDGSVNERWSGTYEADRRVDG